MDLFEPFASTIHTMTGTSTNSQRVLSGMRPTGKLHLGNYVALSPIG